MPVDAPITPAHEFFVGDDKYLLIDIGEPVDTWTVQWVLTPVRDWDPEPAADPLIKLSTGDAKLAVANAPSGNNNGIRITFESDDTIGLDPYHVYYHTLRRTDVGNRGVLSYGTVQFMASALANPNSV